MKIALILITTLLLIVGCSEESITPSYKPESLRNGDDAVFEASFSVEDVEVDEFGGEIGDVPVVGSVFQRLAGMFADISIDDENGTEVVIEPTYFDFPELDQVDFSYIKKVDLKKVHLRVANDDIDGASLSFIKRIEVYLNVDPEIPETEEDEQEGTSTGGTVRPSNEEEDEQEDSNNAKVDDTIDLPWYNLADASASSNKEVAPLVATNNKDDEEEEDNEDSFRDSILLLTYDKDRDTLGCLSKCLDMRVQPVDWRKILMKARSFSIETKLVVDSVPKAKIELGGDIKVQVVVDPGF